MGKSGTKWCKWKVSSSNRTPLGAWPGLGTQPRYEAPGDLQVKIVEKHLHFSYEKVFF